jgi:hypothetical protein
MTDTGKLSRINELFCSLSEEKQDHFLDILQALAFAKDEAAKGEAKSREETQKPLRPCDDADRIGRSCVR